MWPSSHLPFLWSYCVLQDLNKMERAFHFMFPQICRNSRLGWGWELEIHLLLVTCGSNLLPFEAYLYFNNYTYVFDIIKSYWEWLHFHGNILKDIFGSCHHTHQWQKAKAIVVTKISLSQILLFTTLFIYLILLFFDKNYVYLKQIYLLSRIL